VEKCPDSPCRCAWIDVFPYANYTPTGVPQASISVGITSLVGSDLFDPEVAILPRNRSVSRAAVPKAPVDEDSDAASCEYDIWPPANARYYRSVQAVSQPKSKEFAA
jgi:hypothetical protein